MLLFGQADAAAKETMVRHGLDVYLRENWRLIVPLLLAFVGVYFLLPRWRRPHPALGGALAGIGIVLAGLWWIRPEAVIIENALFYAFAAFAILGAVLMLSQTNPVHSALSFALIVLSTCGLFLLLAAPFLMAATIIVYAGAIVVTFLFVIMLAQQEGISNADHRSREPFFASLAGFILLGTLIVVIDRGFDTHPLDGTLAQLETLSEAKTKADVIAVLGEPPANLESVKKKSPLLVEIHEHKRRFPAPHSKSGGLPDAAAVETEVLVDNLDLAWRNLDDPLQVQEAAELAKKLHERGRQMRDRGEVLVPTHGSSVATDGKPLPAANVAGLGRMLFVDYLIPVEMAGVLLLVATIGAIVIATRRSEELR
jgi:NADH:ubiquinone oxidoreductase subunit 6 (subunit J)